MMGVHVPCLQHLQYDLCSNEDTVWLPSGGLVTAHAMSLKTHWSWSVWASGLLAQANGIFLLPHLLDTCTLQIFRRQAPLIHKPPLRPHSPATTR